eukprot:1160859-Pelagomonas_calceolata.AAC.7
MDNHINGWMQGGHRKWMAKSQGGGNLRPETGILCMLEASVPHNGYPSNLGYSGSTVCSTRACEVPIMWYMHN